MDLRINYTEVPRDTIGFSAYRFFGATRKPAIEIIFTKGKVELEMELVERISFHPTSIIVNYKNKDVQFINLENVTQII